MVDILIPTYNRSSELAKNLMLLEKEISQFQLHNSVKIFISDNASTDSTTETVKSFINNYGKINVEYFKQQKNIGLEKNAVSVLSNATAEYVMFLSDDDFLPSGYLQFCLDIIRRDVTIGSVIPGLSSLRNDGSVIEGRRELFKTKRYSKGYLAIYNFSHLGHQMSGIVMKRVGLLDAYLINPEYRNIYLFIYLLSNRISYFDGVYAPEFKILVSVENIKDWSYNDIGLLDEVFKSYYPFLNRFGADRVSDLMIRFTAMHSYRLNFKRNFFQNFATITSLTKNVKGFRRKLALLLLKEYALSMLNVAKK